MSQYFPKPYEPFIRDINVKVDLSNFATQQHLKKATVIDTSNIASKSDLASFNVETNKTNAEKLETILVDLRKLNNVVSNEIVKKTVYDKLVAKVNTIDTRICFKN